MKEVWVNHKLVDFTNAAKQNKITGGCSLLEDDDDEQMESDGDGGGRRNDPDDDDDDDDDPCFNNNCKSGSTCVAKASGTYACKCQPGWSGKYCETGKEN